MNLFWDVPAEILKMSFCLSFFHIVGVLFSVLLFALCCLPCSVAGGVVHMQKTENSLVFVGRKPHAPCSGNARSNQLSVGTRNKYRWKKELKKRTHGTRKQGQKKSIFEAKMAPKMDPGGFQKRVHKTVGHGSGQKCFLGRPKSATRRFWSDFPPTPVSKEYPGIIRGLSNTPNFAHLGPWERTIIKEID